MVRTGTLVCTAAAIVALTLAGVGSTSASFSRTVSNSSSLTAAADFAPLNSVAPKVTGTVALLSSLTRTQGTWINTNVAPTYSYQWQYCPAGINCVDIPGEVGTSYQITVSSLQPILGVIVALPADAGFRVVETATNTWGSHFQSSGVVQ